MRNQKSQKSSHAEDRLFDFGNEPFDFGNDFNVTSVFNEACPAPGLATTSRRKELTEESELN